MENPILPRLGNKIRTLRVEQGMSQEILAEKCNLHRTYIGSVERGERNITLNSLETIAKSLNVDIITLLSESGE